MQYSEQYLISGVFFQEQSGFRLRTVAGEGVVAQHCWGIIEHMYIGTIYRDPHHVLGGYAGTVQDTLGQARLTNILISDTELRFEKRYDNKDPHGSVIHYIFNPGPDSIWRGEYSIPDAEERIHGPTNCVLTPITEDFFSYNLVFKG